MNSVTEYLTVLRLAEQYLIRSEAQVQLNDIAGSQQDVNTIRRRAGLSEVIAAGKDQLLFTIYHERRIEFFSEFAHCWLDLKRSGNIDEVMALVTPSKSNGEPWRTSQQLYPVPLSDIEKNGNLVQNPGY